MKMSKSIILQSINDLSQLIEKNTIDYSKAVILTDENVAETCLPPLIENSKLFQKAEIIVVDPGEESKSLEIADHIYKQLLDQQYDRNCILINLGGGVITDLGGFIASTYKRGIACINIPTSLMAMVDASIGGKTGIDHYGIKNAIGTFCTPVLNLVHPNFIRTLHDNELISGFAEMLKHGLISDCDYWETLSALPMIHAETIIPHIKKSISIKESITESDPHEKGLRKLLNFGHSIGHSIEAYFLTAAKPLSHGTAVACGMLVETLISEEITKLSANAAEDIRTKLLHFFKDFMPHLPSFDKIEYTLFNDKKNRNGELRLTLLEQPGAGMIDCVAPIEVIRSCYEKAIKLIQS
jgi:3-dehydroquinate synthase